MYIALILLVPLSYVDMFMEFTCIYYKFDINPGKMRAIADRCTGLLSNRFAVEIWSSRWCHTFGRVCCCFVIGGTINAGVYHMTKRFSSWCCLKSHFMLSFFFLFRIWIKNTKCQNRLLIDVNFYYVNIDTENRTIFSSFLVYLSICIWCFPILLLLLSTVFSVVVVVRYICFHWP